MSCWTPFAIPLPVRSPLSSPPHWSSRPRHSTHMLYIQLPHTRARRLIHRARCQAPLTLLLACSRSGARRLRCPTLLPRSSALAALRLRFERALSVHLCAARPASDRAASRAAVLSPLVPCFAASHRARCSATLRSVRHLRASLSASSNARHSSVSTDAVASSEVRWRFELRTGVPGSAATTRRASGVHSSSLPLPSLSSSLGPPPRSRCTRMAM